MTAEPAPRPRLSAIKVDARDETFRIVQLVGNLIVCSRANDSCCCGWEEKGRMPFDNALWGDEWERRKIRNKVHLTFAGCLGPCAVGNNALLQIYGQSIWFKDLNDPADSVLVFDYIDAMLAAGRVIAPPAALQPHIFDRYLAAPEAGAVLPVQAAPAAGDEDALAFLDPVCLMEVDPATAKWTVEYDGRTVGFCAPSCRKLFLKEPESYLTAAG